MHERTEAIQASVRASLPAQVAAAMPFQALGMTMTVPFAACPCHDPCVHQAAYSMLGHTANSEAEWQD